MAAINFVFKIHKSSGSNTYWKLPELYQMIMFGGGIRSFWILIITDNHYNIINIFNFVTIYEYIICTIMYVYSYLFIYIYNIIIHIYIYIYK